MFSVQRAMNLLKRSELGFKMKVQDISHYEPDERSDVSLVGCDQVLVVGFSVSSPNDDWRVPGLD